MRPLIAVLLCLGIGAAPSFAQPFRIVTWQVDRLPSARAGVTNSPADEQRFTEVATTLDATDADVIILHGVQDVETARKVAGLLKVRKYSAIHHTAFRHGQRGPTAGSPFAILSRRERLAAKTVEWTHTGRIDNMPGGFGFAAYRFGNTAVAVYVTSLPGSLTNGVSANDGKYFARKRNYAAQYLTHHINWLGTTFTNRVVGTYVTGDFQIAPKGPVKDDGAKLLEAAGFRSLSPGTALDKCAVSITNNAGLDRVQDPVFTKGVEFIASRQINRPAPEHPIVVCDLTFKAPGTTAKAAVKPPPSPAAPTKLAPVPVVEPPPAPIALIDAPARTAVNPSEKTPATAQVASPAAKSETLAAISTTAIAVPKAASPSRQLWIALAAGGVLTIGVAGWWMRRRLPGSRIESAAAPKGIPAPQYLELAPGPAAGPETSVLRESSTATGQTDRIPWESPVIRSGGGGSHARMTPQLRQLMRDVVVAWLARQRAQLLDSHERGTEQVLELHSRVEKIKEQFQERLRSQQQRIAELDTALRNKEKIILELVRTRRPEAGS